VCFEECSLLKQHDTYHCSCYLKLGLYVLLLEHQPLAESLLLAFSTLLSKKDLAIIIILSNIKMSLGLISCSISNHCLLPFGRCFPVRCLLHPALLSIDHISTVICFVETLLLQSTSDELQFLCFLSLNLLAFLKLNYNVLREIIILIIIIIIIIYKKNCKAHNI